MAAEWILYTYSVGSAQFINDLGIEIPLGAGSMIQLDENFSYSEIAGSDDLRNKAANGDVVINITGVSPAGDLSAANGVKYLVEQNVYDLEDKYYSKIQTEALIDASISAETLDAAYSNGRTIDIDYGPVRLDASNSIWAPLELVPQAAAPGGYLKDGQISIIDGILCAFDETRNKWLSVDRKLIAWGKDKASQNQYLSHWSGNSPSNNSGLRMIRDATIVGMSGHFESVVGTGVSFDVEKNDGSTAIATLSVTNATQGNQVDNTNIDLDAGDALQAYFNSDIKEDYPEFIIEIAWRFDHTPITTTTTTTTT